MSWKFEQHTGIIYDPKGSVVCYGYAGGNLGKNKEGINNPMKQSIQKIGPLPQGKYKICDVINNSNLGPFAIRLDPDKTNNMFGRSGFFIHGDTINNPRCASEGCIVIGRAARELINSSNDKDLIVVE